MFQLALALFCGKKKFSETHQPGGIISNGNDEHALQFEESWKPNVLIFLFHRLLAASLHVSKVCCDKNYENNYFLHLKVAAAAQR